MWPPLSFSYHSSACYWILDSGIGEGVIQVIQVCSIGNHGMQHGGCETRGTNPKAEQQCTSAYAGLRILINQLSGSNDSARKLLLLIYKGGIYL